MPQAKHQTMRLTGVLATVPLYNASSDVSGRLLRPAQTIFFSARMAID
jgi:hypothetical protein